MHDPLAVAAILTGTPDEISFFDWDDERSVGEKRDERFNVKVVTEGTFEAAKEGKFETGRTIATDAGPGQAGVRIPRSLDVNKFWTVMEECIQRSDDANKALGKSF